MTRREMIALGMIPGATAFALERSPEFGMILPSGKQALLSQYRGKVVMLEFFKTTCQHCQHSLEIVNKLYKELGPKGLVPFAVATDENAKQVVPAFIKNFGITFPMGYPPKSEAIGAWVREPMPYVPSFFLIDRAGMIAGKYLNGVVPNFPQDEASYRKILEPMLAAKAGARK